MTAGSLRCILCNGNNSGSFWQDKKRPYHQCLDCQLVQVPECFWLDAESEKAEYDLHENSLYDPGYRQFLSRCATPLMERLPPQAKGLDFGCGPSPTLATLMMESGFQLSWYDLYYWPDESPLSEQYDFITATEVIEHLGNPKSVLELWMRCLKPGGVLAIMTKRVISLDAFKSWHYKNDPTHIAFYSDATFRYLAEQYHCSIEYPASDVVFLQKR